MSLGQEGECGGPADPCRDITATLDYYLDELASGEIDARTARQRILQSLENQDLIVVHREALYGGGSIKGSSE